MFTRNRTKITTPKYTMLQNVVHARDHLPIDDVSSPITAAQILEFCYPEFFEETLQNNSEVTSSSNCCYYDENSPYTTNLSLPSDIEKFKTSTPTPTTTTTSTATTSTTTTAAANTYSINNNNSNLSIMFDPQDDLDNEISASIDFSSSPTLSVPQFTTTIQQDPFDNFSSVQQQQPQLSLRDFIVSADHNGLSHQYSADTVPPILAPPLPLPSAFEEDCLSSVPSYFPLNNSSASCSFLGPAMSAFLPTGAAMTSALSAESSGIFPGGILMGTEWQTLELDFQGDNGGIYCPDSIQLVLNPNDLQVLSNDTQQLVSGTTSSSAPLSSEISSLEDPTFKVGKLSVEQRREKIHRYMKKRNERNFSKKIKYACRKTLADSRPRVRGRFAKNDEFGENHRAASSNHEEDDDEDVLLKDEEDMVDSSDIFSHISGVNSFKCNYSIQSWI